VLAQDDPELWERWVNAASLTLLAALRREARHAIDWAGMAGHSGAGIDQEAI